MPQALHSSGLGNPFAKDREEEPELAAGGNAAGFVLQIRNGPTIYHSGDTAYFKDMEVIGERYAPDVALLNIGGHFGVEPEIVSRDRKSTRLNSSHVRISYFVFCLLKKITKSMVRIRL